MTYNELRYTLAMFNKWRSTNPVKYEQISGYLGTKGKCLSLFEYNANEIIKKHYGEHQWNEIYRQTANAMTDFLDACTTLKDLEAEECITFIAELIPPTASFATDEFAGRASNEKTSS